ncbi:hypothetical protein BJV78DRAFT_361436 [Lactifluus subvellereus]|nr:hypothetical protein BJV78DRAFT_361436 [Lactifluus subvellereus]
MERNLITRDLRLLEESMGGWPRWWTSTRFCGAAQVEVRCSRMKHNDCQRHRAKIFCAQQSISSFLFLFHSTPLQVLYCSSGFIQRVLLQTPPLAVLTQILLGRSDLRVISVSAIGDALRPIWWCAVTITIWVI